MPPVNKIESHAECCKDYKQNKQFKQNNKEICLTLYICVSTNFYFNMIMFCSVLL